jgi:hypothetical protein
MTKGGNRLKLKYGNDVNGKINTIAINEDN